jgi:hypothetical protein
VDFRNIRLLLEQISYLKANLPDYRCIFERISNLSGRKSSSNNSFWSHRLVEPSPISRRATIAVRQPVTQPESRWANKPTDTVYNNRVTSVASWPDAYQDWYLTSEQTMTFQNTTKLCWATPDGFWDGLLCMSHIADRLNCSKNIGV